VQQLKTSDRQLGRSWPPIAEEAADIIEASCAEICFQQRGLHEIDLCATAADALPLGCPATSGTDPLATLGIDPSWMCFSVRLVGPFLCPDLVPVRCRAQLRSSMAAGHRRSRPRSVLDGNEHDARLRPVGMNHHAGSVCRAAVGFCSSPLRRFSRSR
jgi:hypothetical protein